MDKTTNRNYKDGLFRMIFAGKEELLGLYNAISGRDYDDPEMLEVNTLQDVVYMGIKNDISFVVDGRLSMYEHQSTWNQNMPLRNLFYISNIYSKLTDDENVHGSKQVPLPNPNFVVFYNGVTEKDDRTIMKLSDAYKVPEEAVNLELKVVALNINKGHNEELMEKCPLLGEYAYYVATVREYKKTMSTKEAVENAIQHCITNGVLAEFLRTHRAEVETVSIFEYDAAKHIAMEKAESKEEGVSIGREIGVGIGKEIGEISRVTSQIMKKVQKSKSLEVIADELECTTSEINHLYELIIQGGPECSVEDVLEQVGKNS